MRSRLWVASVVLIGALPGIDCAAEDSTAGVSVDELRAPTSPAFTILGVAPTNVERPNTPRAIAASVLSSTQRSEFPSELAVEVTPFWWSDHPDLTFDSYYEDQKVGRTILQSLAVSIATSDIADEAIEGTSVAIGTRFQFVAGRPTPELAEKAHALQDLQREFRSCIPDIGEEEAECEGRKYRIRARGAEGESELVPVNDEANELVGDMRAAALAVSEADRQRLGWVIEGALAASVDIVDDRSSEHDLKRYGAWLTASYRIRDPDSLTLVVVARYLKDDRAAERVDMYDLGGRVLWGASKLPLTVALEVVRRSGDGEDETAILGNLEYKIDDTFGLIASYGKGFELVADGSNTVATAGLSFGFGKGATIPAE